MKVGDVVQLDQSQVPNPKNQRVGTIIGFESWPRVRWSDGSENTCAPGILVSRRALASTDPQATDQPKQ